MSQYADGDFMSTEPYISPLNIQILLPRITWVAGYISYHLQQSGSPVTSMADDMSLRATSFVCSAPSINPASEMKLLRVHS
jgi:hypothetical protein